MGLQQGLLGQRVLRDVRLQQRFLEDVEGCVLAAPEVHVSGRGICVPAGPRGAAPQLVLDERQAVGELQPPRLVAIAEAPGSQVVGGGGDGVLDAGTGSTLDSDAQELSQNSGINNFIVNV